MSRIRKLSGGMWYRPRRTPAGAAGWCADIFYIERWGRRWLQREKHFGPYKDLEELKSVFNPEWEKIYDLSNRPSVYKKNT